MSAEDDNKPAPGETDELEEIENDDPDAEVVLPQLPARLQPPAACG